MDKRNWKVIYSDYTGMERKAVELVSRELGRHLNRDKGVFSIHVLSCEKTESEPDCNFVVVGCFETNALIRKYVHKEEIPENGYLVKVVDHPENDTYKMAIVAGYDQRAIFYGAVDFVDDYFAFAAPLHGGLRLSEEIFEQEKLPDYCRSSQPKFKTRSIFTWGQPIIDYRDYIENMARLKFNQLIIWNNFVPINADEVVNYAHEYGIEVLWGYSWGWRQNCADEEYMKSVMSDLPALKERIVKEYEEVYSKIPGDGIYFQSFTELHKAAVDEKVIAEVVTDFVNETANELFWRYPNLHIQFGLHATSVKEQMKYLAQIDERIEILWEDCGSFPYNYQPSLCEEGFFNQTIQFTDEIIHLRKINPIGLVYKGQMTMDWFKFASQRGPYILGKEHKDIVKHDRELMEPIWHRFNSEWVRYGKYAHQMSNEILARTNGNNTMCLAGTLSGEIWYPFALTAQLFWDPTIPYDEMVEMVMARASVKLI